VVVARQTLRRNAGQLDDAGLFERIAYSFLNSRMLE
jgi:hypothetical protein